MTTRAQCLLLGLVCTLAIPTGRALAQGTNGTVPDPISSTELTEYSERLGLTEDQWSAIEGFYESYRNDFKALRETDIQEYLGNVTNIWMAAFRGIDRTAIETSLKQLEKVRSRIESVDGRFFEQVQGVLDEDQVAQLPIVMQSRQRQRYGSGATRIIGFANRAANVDLSQIYRQLELDEAEARETEPYIVQYEAALTKAKRQMYEASSKVFLDLADQMVAAGIDPAAAMGDRESRRAMFGSVMELWTEVSRKPREQADKIGKLNRKTVQQLGALLGSESGGELRGRYIQAAYPEIPVRSSAPRSFRQALALEDLSDKIRNEVQSAADLHRMQRDSVTDEMIKYLDNYRAGWTPRRWGNNQDRDAHQEKLGRYRDRLRDTDRAAIEGLVAVLGPEFASQIDTALATERRDDEEDRGGRFGRGRGRGRERERAQRNDEFGPDPFVPQAVGRRTVVSYGNRLEISDSQAFILESLYEDYLSSLRHVQANEIARLDEVRRAMRPRDGEQNADRTPEQIEQLYELRRRALGAILELDRVLFDDLETIITTDQQKATLQRIRLGRERQVYSRALAAANPQGAGGERRGRQDRGGQFRRGGFGTQSSESAVDLAAVVTGVELSDEGAARADRVLADYETRVTDEFRKQYEVMLELRSETDQLRAQFRGGGGGGDGDRRAREQMRGSFERLTTRSREMRKPVLEINRETMSVLAEALPAEAMTAIRRAYNRKAYPSVYRDEESAQRFLDRARDLPNLSQEQADRIGEIETEFLPAYEAVCDKMVELNMSATQLDFSNRDSWRAMADRRNKIESLEFDRDEVSAKALRQLRDALTEQQQELMDLPDPG